MEVIKCFEFLLQRRQRFRSLLLLKLKKTYINTFIKILFFSVSELFQLS